MMTSNYANARALETLDNAALMRRAPSAFAEAAHESRSERYAYIPTHRVIDALRAEGFAPVSAMQSRSRLGRYQHTKHMIKFVRETDSAVALRVGDSIPQVVLVNSHDGSSTYNLIAGLYRLVCSNGLMVADSTVEALKVPHTGNVVGRVIEGTYTVIEGAARAAEVAADWRSIELSTAEATALALAAAPLRWDTDKGSPIDPSRLLAARRADDKASDLWTTYNRIQENMIVGGQRGRDANARRFTVRPVAAIDGNVKLNRALWELAARMAELKRAA